MRRKLTDPEDLPGDLPELTDRQMRFVESILAGKTASDAYRAAYDCSKSQDNTVWVNASKLRSDANVALWLSAARKAGLGRAAVTLEGHICELERLREIAIDSGNVGAAVQAEQLRGKASGHYTENVNITHSEPASILDEIRKQSPDLADMLAKQHLGHDTLQ
jgi:hypothetical protein